MLELKGEVEFPLARDAVALRLSDARFLVRCVPGVVAVAHSSSAEAVCTLRPGLTFVHGTLEVTMRILEADAGHARLLLASKGIGSSSEVEAALAFVDREGRTRVDWVAQISHLGGLLKAIPKGLIQAGARKVIDDAWTIVSAELTKDVAGGRSGKPSSPDG
jgi:carbon monoxide dehydrogenase subunit G